MSNEKTVALLSVASLVNRVIRAGKFVEETTFYVQDDKGNPVSGKTHKVEEDAVAELGELKFYSEGLAFARAQFPEQSDKGHATKANMIAQYLVWAETGRPVKEATTPAEQEAGAATETDPLDPNAEF